MMKTSINIPVQPGKPIENAFVESFRHVDQQENKRPHDPDPLRLHYQTSDLSREIAKSIIVSMSYGFINPMSDCFNYCWKIVFASGELRLRLLNTKGRTKEEIITDVTRSMGFKSARQKLSDSISQRTQTALCSIDVLSDHADRDHATTLLIGRTH